MNWRKPASKFQIIEWGLSCISGDRDPRAVTSELTSWDNDDTFSSSPTSSSKTINPEERIGRKLTHANLEALLVHFQREFLGGKDRALEVFSTGGGTRSINLAFEAVIESTRSRSPGRSRVKVITGNPHLAVERAERRFQFELIRVPREGALCPTLLKQKITDLEVAAVYTQTL